MIILVALMVAASQVLSKSIYDVTSHNSYVALDSTVPVRIDPATITRIFRGQSPHSVSDPPFKVGFYYSAPARLLLYQPPQGQSYQAGNAISREHATYNNQRNPITEGEYDHSLHHKYKRSDDQGMSIAALPHSEILEKPTYANYYDPHAIRISDYQNPSPSSSPIKFSSSVGHMNEQAYYPFSPVEVQETQGVLQDSAYRASELPKVQIPNSQRQYSQMSQIPYGQPKKGVTLNSQYRDHQGVLATQYVANVNNDLQDNWPQSSAGFIRKAADNSGMGSAQNVYGKYPSVANSFLNGERQFYDHFNTKGYDTPYIAGRFSESEDGLHRGSGSESHNSNIPIAPKPFESQPLVNYHGDTFADDSTNRKSDSQFIIPQMSQIPPSYLVGVEILSNAPISSDLGQPVWDSPNFPKQMVEPWASKMYFPTAYSAGKSNGFQSHPIDLSAVTVQDLATPPLGFRPLPHGYPSNIKPRTPWVVLMVPPDSLLRNNYTGGMKLPSFWHSQNIHGTNANANTIADAQGNPPCRKVNLGLAEPAFSQSGRATDIEKTPTTTLQHPAPGSLESLYLVEQESSKEESTEMVGGRSLGTDSTAELQSQNHLDLSQDGLGQTNVQSLNTIPSMVTKSVAPVSSGSQQLIQHTGKDEVISNTLGKEGKSANEIHPMDAVQTATEEIITGGSSANNDTGMRYTEFEGTESAREKLQAENLILGNSSSKTVSYDNLGNTGTKQQIEKSGTTLVHSAPKFSNSDTINAMLSESTASSVEYTMNVEGENPVQSTNFQKGDRQMDGMEPVLTLKPPLDSNATLSVTTGLAEQEKSRTAKLVADGESSSTMNNHTQSGLAAQLNTYIENDQEPPTAILGNVPSTLKIVQHVAPGYVAQENLHDIDTEMNNEGSSAVTQSSGSAVMQQVEGGNTLITKTALIKEYSSPSQGVSYLREGSTGTYSQNGNIAGERTLTASTDSTVSQQVLEQPNSFGSAAVLGEAPSSSSPEYPSSRIVDTIATPGVEQENLREAAWALKTGETSSVQSYINSGSIGASDKSTEQALDIQTIQSEGGGSKSQVIRYTTEDISDLTLGKEDVSNAVGYNDTSTTNSPQEYSEEANALEPTTTTTYFNEAPSASKIVRFVTSEGTEEGYLREDKISFEKGGSTTGMRHVASGTQQVVEEGDAPHTTTTLVDGSNSGSQVIGYVTEGNTETHMRDKDDGSRILKYNYTEVPHSQQADGLGSTATILGAAPLTKKIISYVTSGEPRVGNLNEIEIPLANDGSSTVLHRNYTDGTGPQQVEEANGLESTKHLSGGAPLSFKPVAYVISEGTHVENAGEGKIATGNIGDSTTARFVSSVGSRAQQITEGEAPQSTSFVVNGGKSSSQIIRYVTAHVGGTGNEGQLTVPHHSYSQKVTEQANSLGPMATLLEEGPSKSKIIHNIITGGAHRGNLGDTRVVSQQIIEEGKPPQNTSTLVKVVEPTSQVVHYIAERSKDSILNAENMTEQYVNLVAEQVDGHGPTKNILAQAPSSSKISHYVTTDEAMVENLGERKVGSESQPSTTVVSYINSGSTGTNHNIETDSLQSTKTILDGAPLTKTVRYVIAKGEVQENMGESNIASENAGISPLAQDTEGSNSQIELIRRVPSSSHVIRYIHEGGRELGLENYKTLGNGGDSIINSHRTTSLQQIEGPENSILVDGSPPTSKIIRYWAGTGGEVQGSDVSEGIVPRSKTTIVKGVPARAKIIRYITTADGEERQEIIDETSIELENERLSKLIGYGSDGNAGSLQQAGITRHEETNQTPVTASKIVRYITTADGLGQKIHGASSITIGDDVPLVAEETEQGQFEKSTAVENGPAGSHTIHYLKAGGTGIEQQLGQPVTVKRIIKIGGAGAQQVIEQEVAPDSTKTVMDGSPAFKTIRYVSKDVGNPQMVGASNANQPLQTITRYITLPTSDTASNGQSTLQHGGSTLTRYVTVPDSGRETSQYLIGQGSIQSSGNIVHSAPSTVTRYLTYPQNSEATGVRYTQNILPRTSTIIKPVSFIPDALPRSAE